MRAASSLYEHPDFSDASFKRTLYTIAGAVTVATTCGVVVYRLATSEKTWDIGSRVYAAGVIDFVGESTANVVGNDQRKGTVWVGLLKALNVKAL